MSRKILGLSIRHNTITATVVGTSIKGPTIDDFVHVPIPDPSETDEGISLALADVAERIDIAGCISIVSLPADLVSFRNIQVPFKEKKKIGQILSFELEPILPFPIDDLTIAFQTIKTVDPARPTDLLTAGIETSVLNTYTDALASVNIHPKTITIGGCALAACLARYMDTPGDWMVVDVSTRSTTVIGVSSGQICVVRTLGSPVGKSPDGQAIGKGIHQTLAGFEDLVNLDFTPEVLFLTGDGLNETDLVDELSGLFDLPVQKADLFHHGNLSAGSRITHSWNAVQMDNALALSLAEIEGIDSLNFRKGPFTDQNLWVVHRRRLIKTGILAAMVLVSAISYMIVDTVHIGRRISQLDQQILNTFKTTFPEVKTVRDPYLQMQVKLKEVKKKALISSDPGENIRAIDMLNQISRSIPDDLDVNLTRLVIGDGTVQITGDTSTFEVVEDIKNRIEQAELFKKVTTTSANKEKSGNRIRFKLKVEL